jgi:hypothetical protein
MGELREAKGPGHCIWNILDRSSYISCDLRNRFQNNRLIGYVKSSPYWKAKYAGDSGPPRLKKTPNLSPLWEIHYVEREKKASHQMLTAFTMSYFSKWKDTIQKISWKTLKEPPRWNEPRTLNCKSILINVLVCISNEWMVIILHRIWIYVYP